MPAVSSVTLPPTTDSVPQARKFARTTLKTSTADVDTVLLLVSEVVTNAVLHARSAVRLASATGRGPAWESFADELLAGEV